MPEIPENFDEAADSGLSLTDCCDSLDVGVKVWIYDGKAPPRNGIITASGDCIIAGAWYARDTYGESLYSRYVLFTDPEKLIAEVRNTVDLLERWERDLQAQADSIYSAKP